MWFFLGVITLVGVASVLVRRRLEERWTGSWETWNSLGYWYARTTRNGGEVEIRIGVTSQTAIEFHLKPESSVDRFFKKLGLSVEQQLDRLHFDENIYVVSDDARLSNALKRFPALLPKLEYIFERSYSTHFNIRGLWCQSGRLWLVALPKRNLDEAHVTAELVEQTVPVLSELAEVLESAASPNQGSRDQFIYKAALLLGISSTLAVAGVILYLRFSNRHFPFVLEHSELILHAASGGVILLAALLFVCIQWLGRTSRAHLVLLELLFVGGMGVFSLAYYGLREYNIVFDRQPERSTFATIAGLQEKSCGRRRSRTCYYVSLVIWPEQQVRKLRVDPGTYRHLHGRSQTMVNVHHGALGMKWIEAPR